VLPRAAGETGNGDAWTYYRWMTDGPSVLGSGLVDVERTDADIRRRYGN
jgi:hypothetical protein